jgi:hypothetical protein
MRPGADPRFLDRRPDDAADPLPGSSIWREALEEASAQLPTDATGFIAVSCDAHMGLDDDTCAALFGDPVLVLTPDPRGWGSLDEERRLANGFFHDLGNSHVAGVWFFRLTPQGAGEDATLLCDWARGSLNPRFRGERLPDLLTYAIPNVIGEQD